MSVSGKGEVALFVGRGVNKSSGGKGYSRHEIREEGGREQKRSTEESATGSTGTKQNAGEYAKVRDSTPPPLGGTSGGSPPSRREVLFNLFLDNLRGSSKGSFLDDILDSGRLGTVNLDRGRKLNGCRDGCNTGICWSRSSNNDR